MNLAKNFKITRKDNLLKSVVFIDGQAGCGKTLLNSIIASYNRVELMNYAPEVENLCILKNLNKISNDAVESLIKIQMDLTLYETMMSRRVNFRPTDLSSAFKDKNFSKYLKRLKMKGDEHIPKKIQKENPILHFAVHNLLPYSAPIFKSLNKKAKFIEVVRHPLYMIIQQTLNHYNIDKRKGSARQFRIYLEKKGKSFPFTSKDNYENYYNMKPIERAIYEISNFTTLSKKFKKTSLATKNKIITIPFEEFVLIPNKYIKKFEKFLNTSISNKTRQVLKEQNIPRLKISDGIPLDIYKRCGWKPPIKGLSEKEELEQRRQFVINEKPSKEYIDKIDSLSADYENQYFKDININ